MGERNHFTFFNWCTPASQHPLVQQCKATLYPTTCRADQATIAALAATPVQLESGNAGSEAGSQAGGQAADQETALSAFHQEELERAARHPGWTFMQVCAAHVVVMLLCTWHLCITSSP